METKQNAKQFCLVQLEKRRTESWMIYVPMYESISNFLVRLKHLASTYEFGSFLKRVLSDKIVWTMKFKKNYCLKTSR